MEIPKLTELLNGYSGKLYTKAVCMVQRKGEIIFRHSVNCQEDTWFDLASITKVLTGTMVLSLVGEGKLSLDQTLLSLFAKKDLGGNVKERFSDISPERLMTHSSGIIDWYPFYTQKGNFWRVLDFVLGKYPRIENVVYSDINFMILGEAIGITTGLNLNYNLGRLNKMLDTKFVYNPQNHSECAETECGNKIEMEMCRKRGLNYIGFRETAEHLRGEANDGNAFYFFFGEAGHAGAFGRAADLLSLGELYINKGRYMGERIIPRDLVEKSFHNHGEGRGLMWDLSDMFPRGAGHTGFTGTSLWVCPDAEMTTVILTNRLAIEPPPNLKDFRLTVHNFILEAINEEN